jgi:hypothetical protein
VFLSLLLEVVVAVLPELEIAGNRFMVCRQLVGVEAARCNGKIIFL